MPRRCKLCSSNLKSDIETLILQGYTFTHCERYAKDRGLEISEKAITRHADNHMESYQRRSDLREQTEQKAFNIEVADPNIIDIEAIQKQLKYNPNSLSDAAKVLLGQILLNQLNIVVANQQSYMDGLGRYPGEQLRGLHLIFDLLDKVSPKNLDLEKKFNGNYVFLELKGIADE